ncbi:hypothetical protein NBRC116495_25850 [Aurantivibrio plasticivorans]
MYLALLTMNFKLTGCYSLKEKRSRLRGLKDKFGKNPNLALSESKFHDDHQQAQWQAAVLCESKATGQKLFEQIRQFVHTVDAVLIDSYVEVL